MLKSTFCHIPGIGHATEKKLWEAGICNWQDLLDTPDCVRRVSAHEIINILESSLNALDSDPRFFTRLLKAMICGGCFPISGKRRHTWTSRPPDLGRIRKLPRLPFMTAMTSELCERNKPDDFLDDIHSYQVLVSYNGVSFDIPFIERFFSTTLNQAQIDLRFILARLGCKGGLKGCERQFGINRGVLDGVDGSFAVTLWHHYQRYNDQAALETLLAYNVEDTVNLERLMVEAYNRNIDMTPFAGDLELPFPQMPRLDYQPDPEIMDQYRKRYWF